jgi:hypothetical protein
MTIFTSGNTWKNLNRVLVASTIWILLSIALKIKFTTSQNHSLESFDLLNNVVNFFASIVFTLNSPVFITLGIATILCLIGFIISIFDADSDTNFAETRFFRMLGLLIITAFIFTGFRILTESNLIVLLTKAVLYGYGLVESVEIFVSILLALILAGGYLFEWLRNYLLL